MPMITTPCNKKMTMTEFSRHIPKCHFCVLWWTRQSKLNKENRTK